MVDGAKMSKSRGTFVMARTYLDVGLEAEALRYYFAAKSGGGVEDLDLNLSDFTARVNADLVGKFVNLASRCAGFISKRFDGRLADSLPDAAQYDRFVAALAPIREAYERNDPAAAVRLTMTLADEANRYIDDQKPWVIAKQEGADAQLQAVCTQGLNLFRVLVTALKPILPATAAQADAFLAAPVQDWTDVARPLTAHTIAVYAPLFTRIDPKMIDAMTDASKDTLAAAAPAARPSPPSLLPHRHRRCPPHLPTARPTSASTTSPSSTCASARCWSANAWTARTSCCASNWMPATSASARSSPVSAPATANRRSWSAAAWSSSPTWPRARCVSA